jgi:hypothetical protein
MTALSLAARPAKESTLRPLPWRNMLWVTWRQHRATLISIPAVFAAVGLCLLFMGLYIHHAWATVIACHPAASQVCQQLNQGFNSTDWPIGNGLHIMMSAVPALIGAFAGGSLLARELETGTYRYAWTQGIGRERWTIAKLVIIAVTVTAAAGALSQLFTWFFTPFLSQQGTLTPLSAGVFDTSGIAFAAWTLLAFTVGALAGMLFRHTVPAMAVTLGVYIGIRLLTWLVLRNDYGVSTYWPEQLIQAAWQLALSVLLIATTVSLVRRRPA